MIVPDASYNNTNLVCNELMVWIVAIFSVVQHHMLMNSFEEERILKNFSHWDVYACSCSMNAWRSID